LIFPRENNITRYDYPGQEKTDHIYDTTAIFERERMTSGLLTNLIPAGQKFFSLTTLNAEIREIDAVKSYMARSTEIEHEELFTSNFLLQIAETLNSLITFGTGNIFTEWRQGLNFMDWDVSRYHLLENFRGEIDTVILKFPKTALQAYNKWGEAAGKSVVEVMNDKSGGADPNKWFWFIHIVRPRQWRNPRLEDFLNMAFESGYINFKDKTLIEEGGFPEFPYMIPRWAKTTGEVHGRGIGTMILPHVKALQANKRDFQECANKIVNPHREILDTYEGDYLTVPGAWNSVTELPSSYVDPNQFGNFPVGEKYLEMERRVVMEAFYHDAFAPLTGLTGDRRNELEIQQRIQEAFRAIGSPIGRLESELFTPLIIRCYKLLVTNRVIPPPPEELQGQTLKIMYKGPLSLAQQDSEVRASRQWVSDISAMEENENFAGASDNVNVDNMARRLGRVYGVNEDDIASEEEVEAKRAAKQVDKERREALEAAQVGGQAYGQTTKAPEPGSAAEQLQGVANG
jgi:hypothetical protein